MTSKAVQGNENLRAHAMRFGCTEKGAEWLSIALDPFKDQPEDMAGLPDRTANRSVVQCIPVATQVSTPSGLAGQNWDASVFVDPLWVQTNLRETTIANGTASFAGQVATDYPRGGLNVRTALTGTQMDTLTSKAGLSLPTDMFANNTSARLIGLGLEIHDTSAQLYKQGFAVAWRDQDVAQLETLTATDGGTNVATVPTAYQGVKLVEPPYTLAQAEDLQVSKGDDQLHGKYCVGVLANPDTLPSLLTNFAPHARDLNQAKDYYPAIQEFGTQKWCIVGATNIFTSFQTFGVFMSGLGPNSTFTAELKAYFEIFPDKVDRLRRNARSCTPFDPRALELYTIIASKMTPGVWRNANALGDWISGIADLAGAAVSLMGPIGRAVGMGIATVNGLRKLNRDTSPNIAVARPPLQLGFDELSSYGGGVPSTALKRIEAPVHQQGPVIMDLVEAPRVGVSNGRAQSAPVVYITRSNKGTLQLPPVQKKKNKRKNKNAGAKKAKGG